MRIMHGTRLLLVAIVLLINFPTNAQNDTFAAPVKWERYKVSFLKISVVFPKMPVAAKRSDPCAELAQHTYVAYAREVVYTFVINYKIPSRRDYFCSSQRQFGQKYFDGRIAELAQMKEASAPEKLMVNGRPAVMISANSTKHWIIDDTDNDRWFELWISNRPDAKPEEATFVNSLATEGEAGIDIADGAERTLGDAATTEPSGTTEVNINPAISQTFQIRFKPKASYTDAARRNNVAGSVRLKLTLLSNGGVGNITPVTELPHGLTEQAITAAKRVVFIPKKVNGVNVSVVVTFEYTFSIY